MLGSPFVDLFAICKSGKLPVYTILLLGSVS